MGLLVDNGTRASFIYRRIFENLIEIGNNNNEDIHWKERRTNNIPVVGPFGEDIVNDNSQRFIHPINIDINDRRVQRGITCWYDHFLVTAKIRKI